MYVLITLYFIKLLICVNSSSTCIPIDPFIKDDTLAGKTFSAGTIVKKENISERSTCASKCKKYDNCLSYFYNADTETCQLNSVVYTSTQGSQSSAGNEYYRKRLECPSTSPEIEHATEEFDVNSIQTREGTHLQYICDAGYSQIGRVECAIDGQWTTMTCREGCKDPPNIQHSEPQFDVTNPTTTVGSRLQYACHAEYQQIGEVVCQANTQWTSMVCKRLCPAPPTFEKAESDAVSGSFVAGDVLSYKCSGGYIAVNLINKITCQSDGTWTSIQCIPIASCSQIHQCRRSYPDGDFWVYPPALGGNKAKIYCHNLAGIAKEFVSLLHVNVGLNPNATNRYCRGEETGRCSTSHHPGETHYKKIKVNIMTMEVDQENTEFAETTFGTSLKYGQANDCYCIHTGNQRTSCGPKGTFNIDVSGTGFKVDPELEFIKYGWSNWGEITKSSDGTRIDLLCAGWIGGCRPDGDMFLKRYQPQEPPQDSAVTPHCVYYV